MADKAPEKKKSKFSLIVIIFVVALVGGTIGFIIYLKNYSAVSNRTVESIPSFYVLPENYTNQNLFEAYAKIRRNPEFKVYFNVLSKDQAQNAFVEITDILDKNRNKEALKYVLDGIQDEVKALSEAFFYLDYDAAFFADPSASPGLNKVLNSYLENEFKLTVLGAFYKATYDNSFTFSWSNLHIVSARKMLGVLSYLQQRNAEESQ